MKLFFFLQILNVWVQPAQNQTPIDAFNYPLVQRTTALVIEEYIQEEQVLRLVSDKMEADIIVKPYFIGYRRPNTDISLAVLQVKEEEVFLTMRMEFYFAKYNFAQNLICTESLVRKAGSNFLDIQESETDFAESMVFNLIKKTINGCFQDFESLIF
jgi:hypothetical protein